MGQEEDIENMEAEVKVKTAPLRLTPTIEHLVGTPKKFATDILNFSEKEGIFKMMGVDPDKTFVTYGPPGTGKSMCVDAIYNTANIGLTRLLQKKVKQGEKLELGVSQFNMLHFSYDIGKYGTAYINMSSRKIQSFFDAVGFYAQMGRRVLVSLDECDALLGSRQGNVQTHAEDRKTLETIMKNLQVMHDTPNVYVVMMTNLPEICDNAALRAGRIDRRIKFDLPDSEQRYEAYKHFIQELRNKAEYPVIRKAYYGQLAEMSEGFNYADIKNVVYGAVKRSAEEIASVKEGGILPIGYVHQKQLMEEVTRQRTEFHDKKQKRKIGF